MQDRKDNLTLSIYFLLPFTNELNFGKKTQKSKLTIKTIQLLPEKGKKTKGVAWRYSVKKVHMKNLCAQKCVLWRAFLVRRGRS